MRRLAIIAAAGAALVASAGPAAAEPSPVSVDDVTPELAEDDAGGFTVELQVTNLTDTSISNVAISLSGDGVDQNCEPSVGPGVLPAASKTKVTVAIQAVCGDGEDGFDFELTAGGATVPISAEAPKDDRDPDWGQLWAFAIALGGGALLFIVLALVWEKPANTPGFELWVKLDYLDATWSFKESWATNATAAATILTGVFGANEVVTSLLGEDAEQSIALATVGSAVAVALVAASVLFVQAARTADGASTLRVWGLLVAATVTFGATAGELWIVYQTAESLDLGGPVEGAVLTTAAVVALLLLIAYSWVSTLSTLRIGSTEPDAEPEVESDTDRLAAAVRALAGAFGVTDPASIPEESLNVVMRYLNVRGSKPVQRVRRSAIL